MASYGVGRGIIGRVGDRRDCPGRGAGRISGRSSGPKADDGRGVGVLFGDYRLDRIGPGLACRFRTAPLGRHWPGRDVSVTLHVIDRIEPTDGPGSRGRSFGRVFVGGIFFGRP